MIKVRLEGLKEIQDQLARAERQIPFAVALGLTRTAQIAKREIEADMASVFDRPTRWTLNSLRLFPAKKDKLEARVWMKNEADKSVPATRWLNPEIEGGPRQDKRSEARLRRHGALPGGKYIVPGKGARLDRHGNLTKGTINKVISGLKAFGDAGYYANATNSKRSLKKGNAQRYFVMRRGTTPIGIAERTSRRRMHMLLAFVSRPTYRRRLDFYGTGERVVRDHLDKEVSKALEQAMKTAR
jgi:hypothetical protein